jgi:hypothetical protein
MCLRGSIERNLEGKRMIWPQIVGLPFPLVKAVIKL